MLNAEDLRRIGEAAHAAPFHTRVEIWPSGLEIRAVSRSIPDAKFVTAAKMVAHDWISTLSCPVDVVLKEIESVNAQVAAELRAAR
jgi:hypothetical protein